MKLINLIDVADRRISLILKGVENDGSELVYNFKTNSWDSNMKFNKDQLITVEEFRKSGIYKKTAKNNRIEDFGSFHGGNIEAFKDVELYNGIIMKVSIFIGIGKSNVARAIDAKLEKLAEKRKPNPQPKKKKHDNRNKSWRKFDNHYTSPKAIHKEDNDNA